MNKIIMILYFLIFSISFAASFGPYESEDYKIIFGETYLYNQTKLNINKKNVKNTKKVNKDKINNDKKSIKKNILILKPNKTKKYTYVNQYERKLKINNYLYNYQALDFAVYTGLLLGVNIPYGTLSSEYSSLASYSRGRGSIYVELENNEEKRTSLVLTVGLLSRSFSLKNDTQQVDIFLLYTRTAISYRYKSSYFNFLGKNRAYLDLGVYMDIYGSYSCYNNYVYTCELNEDDIHSPVFGFKSELGGIIYLGKLLLRGGLGLELDFNSAFNNLSFNSIYIDLSTGYRL